MRHAVRTTAPGINTATGLHRSLSTLPSGTLLRVARQADDRIRVARSGLAQDRLFNTSRLAIRLLERRALAG